ncbi:MAG: hypothetical protein H6Q42_1704, partial [Deltaproteobacteria bacterium]|nr:hypothetical protein [Deltaproteobacteria bacterium]
MENPLVLNWRTILWRKDYEEKLRFLVMRSVSR